MGLMFPKSTRKSKKRKAHKASILHEKDGTCYLCMMKGIYRIHRYTEEHHIYGGPNRAISEANGFKCHLCPDHHRNDPEAVHNNMENMRLLQRECQRVYEETHTRKEFMELIGRNYLD